MKQRVFAILAVFALLLSLAACGDGEETTLTGMVAAVDGSVISLMEMKTGNMGGENVSKGERPEMPEGMEDFDPENFDPEQFGGMMPNGEEFDPENFDPENFDPENFKGMAPDGERPEMPEGMTPPENGEKPEYNGEEGGMFPGAGKFASDAETKAIDLSDAHISVEDNGSKVSGSMDDIKTGSFVTVTVNGKGKATHVLVSPGFGGGRRSANETAAVSP